jgi:hypothetical protein
MAMNIGVGVSDLYGSYSGMGQSGIGYGSTGGYSDTSIAKANGKTGSTDCETCKSRKYQDGSDENVSFKSASHISPQASGVRVAAHEAEHVSNAYTKASEAGGEVVSASVSIHTAVCPECGRVYVSGGETTTMIKYPNESNPYQQDRKTQDALSYVGASVNFEG